MSWFNQKIYSEKEIRELGSGSVPAEHQIGEQVFLEVEVRPDKSPVKIRCYIIGINISNRHEIQYDLAFAIAPGYYARLNGFRGYVSRAGEELGPGGGLLGLGVVEEGLQQLVESGALDERPVLTLVPVTDKP
jgi:hypothetical protein